MTRTSALVVALVVAGLTRVASAQMAGITLPEASPAAELKQRIGMTDVTVVYHRPAVNKRTVWGELVPWNEVWRAGANENTTVTFSSAVKVQGKDLAAGTYGLHMIPTNKDWTVIFSKMSVAWGSFSYDEKEDALRVTVTPRPGTRHVERLSYEIDDPTETTGTLVLRWASLEVPVALDVDTPSVVRGQIAAQLRGPARFGWLGWNEAARYWLRSGGDLDEALQLTDRSIGMQRTFQNVTTRAMILEKKGDAKGAAALRAEALAIAGEADVNQRAYELLLQEKKVDEALVLFRKNVKDHPASWNAHDSLGEALASKGDKKGAIQSYTRALLLSKDEGNRKRIETTLANLKK